MIRVPVGTAETKQVAAIARSSYRAPYGQGRAWQMRRVISRQRS